MGQRKESAVLLGIYNRRQKLLDMMYTPAEIAEELNISKEYVYHHLMNTAEIHYTKDETGHVWINGMDIYRWIEQVFSERRKKRKNVIPLMENEFYCMRCKARKITNDYKIIDDSWQRAKTAFCPDCGARMRKYVR